MYMMGMVIIPLPKGQQTIVDEIDGDFIQYIWKFAGAGYVCRRLPGTKYYAESKYLHREIMERILGEPIPDNLEVDHVNLDKLDNRRENLRLVTHHENTLNKGVRKGNKSGYRGVSMSYRIGKWRARLKYKGKEICFGNSFDTPEEAYQAFLEGFQRICGESA